MIARAYLAAVMPDFRYRQTTAMLDVAGFPFKATGRQPIDLGWRSAFQNGRRPTKRAMTRNFSRR